ncbi:zinc finger domain-containing protein [Streptomyces sp. NBC_00566]|uniref:zinc finger domain-containing protein n=1 Tax=Streptomyces sp. NBC_00566 TaxID=2975778 RepID=UPI002E8053B2|nr:cell surface glycoprotein [Streptomyces sp. NBC_00566]WUB88231.1 cell surface glycoprotein [Streptomyces sp. NBC_00566]
MNVEHVPELIAKIAMADPRVKRTDPIERRAQLEMWAGILADVPLEFALQATHAHYAESQWAITAGDIATRWREVVRDRLSRHTRTFDPSAHPEIDPDDIAGYLAIVQGEHRAVVHGHELPRPVRKAIGGPAAQEAAERIAELGDYIGDKTRAALAPFRPRTAERERLVREGHGDPLSVACPYEHCRAGRGKPCRNARRHDRRTPHPSRIELAAGGAQSAEQTTTTEPIGHAPGAWPTTA